MGEGTSRTRAWALIRRASCSRAGSWLGFTEPFQRRRRPCLQVQHHQAAVGRRLGELLRQQQQRQAEQAEGGPQQRQPQALLSRSDRRGRSKVGSARWGDHSGPGKRSIHTG